MASIPKPLAVRADSLLVKVTIAAAFYFVPQDALALGLYALAARAKSRNANAPAVISDPKSELSSYLKARGLDEDKVHVKEGRSLWEVKLKSVYQ